MQRMAMQSSHTFAHATTAGLSYHGKNCDQIESLEAIGYVFKKK